MNALHQVNYFSKYKKSFQLMFLSFLIGYHARNLASPSAGCHVVRELTSPTFSRSDILPNNYFVNLLGINRGVGVPEDAISDDLSLGHCWPMKVILYSLLYILS